MLLTPNNFAAFLRKCGSPYRLLGVDYGRRRIGVAFWDGQYYKPLSTIHNNPSKPLRSWPVMHSVSSATETRSTALRELLHLQHQCRAYGIVS